MLRGTRSFIDLCTTALYEAQYLSIENKIEREY